MLKFLKHSIYRIFQKMGYGISRIPKYCACYNDQKRLLSNDDNPVIFDVGAHHGQTIQQYKAQFPNASIFSFEPFAPSFQQLAENTKCFSNITLLNLAVGNQTGDTVFHSNKNAQTNSILPIANEAELHWGKNGLEIQEKMMVKCIRLDDFIREKKIPQIDILKIDTQGFEYEVLEGAKASLKAGIVKIVYCEVILAATYEGQHTLDQIITLLNTAHFALYNIYNPSYTFSGRLRQVDILFIHQSLLSKLEK